MKKLLMTKLSKATASALKTPDTFLLEGVLASNIPNLNDDYLMDLFTQKDTILYKPVDIEHEVGDASEKSEVIGTVSDVRFEDLKGEKLTIDLETDLPTTYNLGIQAVIWGWLFTARATEIKDSVANYKLSMECYFSNYDYAIYNMAEKQLTIVKRNKETVILDKYLRSKNGIGKVAGHRIYRAIRNPIFGGVAIVKVPANPLSIIREVADIKDNINLDNNNDYIRYLGYSDFVAELLVY